MKISAIITCHNYGQYLPACLESVLRQSLPFDEIILIDDSSTDSTAEIARKYSDLCRYERVDFKNVALTRQFGFLMSRGEYIVCIDADNWLLPDFNRELHAVLQSNPDAGAAYCGAHYTFQSDRGRAGYERLRYPMMNYSWESLMQFNYIDMCSMVRRKAWVAQDPGLEFYEDWDQWLSMVDAGWKAKLVKKRLFYYRVHDKGYTRRQSDTGGMRDFERTVRKRHEKDLVILTLFSGRDNILDVFLERLDALRKPQRTGLVFIDNSSSKAFNRRLKTFGAKVISVPLQPRLPLNELGHEKRGYEVAVQTERLYRYAQKHVWGRNVLILEHDVLPPIDVINQLIESRRSTGADLISGAMVSRITSEYLAWRLKGPDPSQGLRRVNVTRGARRVFATGLGCLLLESDIFHCMPMTARGNYPFYGVDVHAGAWAWKQNLRWFVDGRIRCRHLDEEGDKVRLGQVKGMTGGALANLGRLD